MAIVFDTKRGLYRNGDTYLTRQQVREEIERIVRYFNRQSRLLADSLFDEVITLADWQTRMRDLIKDSAILTNSIGFGGVAQMNSARWGAIGGRMRFQYNALNQYARHIEQGKVILKAQAIRRSSLYSSFLRAMYFKAETEVARATGFTESRRVLHALEHCSECLEWSRAGYVDINSQPDIGRLKCGQFCRCTLEYR